MNGISYLLNDLQKLSLTINHSGLKYVFSQTANESLIQFISSNKKQLVGDLQNKNLIDALIYLDSIRRQYGDNISYGNVYNFIFKNPPKFNQMQDTMYSLLEFSKQYDFPFIKYYSDILQQFEISEKPRSDAKDYKKTVPEPITKSNVNLIDSNSLLKDFTFLVDEYNKAISSDSIQPEDKEQQYTEDTEDGQEDGQENDYIYNNKQRLDPQQLMEYKARYTNMYNVILNKISNALNSAGLNEFASKIQSSNGLFNNDVLSQYMGFGIYQNLTPFAYQLAADTYNKFDYYEDNQIVDDIIGTIMKSIGTISQKDYNELLKLNREDLSDIVEDIDGSKFLNILNSNKFANPQFIRIISAFFMYLYKMIQEQKPKRKRKLKK